MLSRRAVALLLLVGLTASSIVWLSCQGSSPNGGTVHVVKLDGAELCRNLSLSQFLWSTGEPGKRPAYAAARDGDLLLLNENKGGETFVLRYRAAGGEALTVAYDDVTGRGLIGDKTVSISLKSDAAWNWLAKASETDRKSLRFLALEGAVTTEHAKILEAFSQINPAVDLLLGEDAMKSPPEDLVRTLSTFRPRLLLTDAEVLKGPKPLAEMLRGVEVLWLNGDAKDVAPDLVAEMPRLESLFMENAAAIQSLGLAKSKTLRALSVADKDMKDLAAVASLAGLEELTLSGEKLADISLLIELKNLHVLSLSACPAVRDVAPLKGLPLRWLALPPSMTQVQFNAILADHPALEGLELIAAGKLEFVNLKDIAAVEKLKNLRFLSLTDVSHLDPNALDMLKQLKGLRLLVLSKGLYGPDETARLADLQKALPDTIITEGKGICLGSGWILILLPLIMMPVVIGAAVRRRRQGQQK
jgi:hypothetical protein